MSDTRRTRVRARRGAAAALAVAIALGCGDDGESARGARPSTEETSPTPVAEAEASFEPVVGGVGWRAEAPFVADRPDNALRSFEYKVQGADDALLTVSHFPAAEGGGGGIAANIERWTGQFEGAAEPRVERREVQDLPVTLVALSGTFVGRLGHRPAPPRHGWRMLGAIVEAPSGLVFFKLLGPAEAIERTEDSFERLVESLHPA